MMPTLRKLLVLALLLPLNAACSGATSSASAEGSAAGSGSGSGEGSEPDAVADTEPSDTAPVLDSGEPLGSADTDNAVDTEGSAEPDTAPPACGLGRRPVVYGSDLVAGTIDAPLPLPRCAAAAFAGVLSSGTTWRIEVADLPSDARLFAYGPSFFATAAAGDAPPPLASTDFAGADSALELLVRPAFSGEVVVVVERDDLDAEQTARVTVTCVEGCERAATRFPVMLVHGYFGTDTYFSLLDYFHDVPDRLRNAGFEVRTPTTDAFNWSEIRGEQLAEQLDALLVETGARKVNMIAHSQGGMDARVVISGLGYAERVATLTTVATPHRGTPLAVADIASVQDFSPDYLDGTFNPAYPDRAEVKYFSWSARTCGLLEFGCQREMNGEIADAILGLFQTSLTLRVGDNDGFVPTDSMVWGEQLGRLSADHLDEVGQIADGSPRNDPFDHRAFYLSELRRLSVAGY
jgi:triacylglycerol lipase